MRYSLDLSVLRAVNLDRARYWHKAHTWSTMEWAAAMCGEAGETVSALLHTLAHAGEAANVAKKLRRVDQGIHSNNNAEREILKQKLAKELADTLIYLDLVAANENIDLAKAVIDTFNQVSEREGMLDKFKLESDLR